MITHNEAKTILETWLPVKQYGSFDSVKKLQEYIRQEEKLCDYLEFVLRKTRNIFGFKAMYDRNYDFSVLFDRLEKNNKSTSKFYRTSRREEMTADEFGKSIKQYYIDKQKEKTEVIYVDIDKLIVNLKNLDNPELLESVKE